MGPFKPAQGFFPSSLDFVFLDFKILKDIKEGLQTGFLMLEAGFYGNRKILPRLRQRPLKLHILIMDSGLKPGLFFFTLFQRGIFFFVGVPAENRAGGFLDGRGGLEHGQNILPCAGIRGGALIVFRQAQLGTIGIPEIFQRLQGLRGMLLVQISHLSGRMRIIEFIKKMLSQQDVQRRLLGAAIVIFDNFLKDIRQGLRLGA
ncbi:MAG: hypothetical protein HZC18_08470 [Candidatus Omnitrophica bacterium]|nr:hypothetical protein [Candidatus Omnitrophota bacterium]